MSPAGSGYAEYVAAESVECFTGGDCASVVVQYGVLPSVLSLRRVELGALTVRTLLDRLAERLREMPDPPRVLMYGRASAHGSHRKPCRSAPVWSARKAAWTAWMHWCP